MASIPVAVPVSDMDFPKTSSEEYELEQKKDALYRAEQDLVSVIASAEDFFDTPTEKEETLQRIKNNPEAILSSSEKPFMKKIARVMVAVATLTQEVEAATELVADQHLTPAQVKAHIHKVCKEQQVFLEKKMEERLIAERANTTILLDHMQKYFQRQLDEQKTYFERQLALDRAKMEKALEAGMAREAKLRSLSTEVEGQRKTVQISQDQLRSLSAEVKMKPKEIQVLKSKLKEFSEDVYMMISECQWLANTHRVPYRSGADKVYDNLHRYSQSVAKKYGFGGLMADPESFIASKISNLKISKLGEGELPVLVDFDE